jgi:hypothetical protein
VISGQPSGFTPDSSSEAWGWFTPRRFGVFLAALFVAEFPDVLLGFKTFAFRDFGLFGYPLAHYYRESLWQGELPLWNPLNNLGLPFLAQWNTMVLYPPSLFYALFPLWWSLPVFCLAHLWLAGLGMYFLAYRWTGNRLAAAVAGVAFAINGLTLNLLTSPNDCAALGWMPWVVFTTETACQRGGRSLITASVVGALQMLAGAPEAILFTWALSMVLVAAHWRWEPGAWIVTLRRFLLVVLVVTGLAAAQLFPFLDLFRHSHREAGFAGSIWSLPPWGWANLIVPLFRTFRSSSGVFFQPGQSFTSSYYLGIGIVALALGALWRARERRVWMLGGLAVVSLVLALGDGGYVYGWLRKAVPALGFMRYPVKYLIILAFVLPLLAAHGLRVYLLSIARSRAEALRFVAVLGLFLLCLLLGIVWFSARFPFPYETWPVTLRSGVTRGLLLALILGTLYGLPLAARPKLLQYLLLLLVWLDCLSHTPRQNPTVEPSVYARLAALDQLTPKPVFGDSRAMLSREASKVFYNLGPSNLGEALLGRRLGLHRNSNLLDDIAKVDGFYSLYLLEESDVELRLYGADDQPRSALVSFLGVSQISARGNVLAWEARTNYLPLVTAGQAPVFADTETTLAGLSSSNFAPREIVYLPPAAKTNILVKNGSRAEIISRKASAHKIEVVVEAPAPAMVVVAQAYYHPWRAYVDGQPVSLWRANHAFQALEVHAGQSRVKLVYEDRLFFWGAVISTFTFMGGAAAWWKLGSR